MWEMSADTSPGDFSYSRIKTAISRVGFVLAKWEDSIRVASC